LYSLKIISVVR